MSFEVELVELLTRLDAIKDTVEGTPPTEELEARDRRPPSHVSSD